MVLHVNHQSPRPTIPKRNAPLLEMSTVLCYCTVWFPFCFWADAGRRRISVKSFRENFPETRPMAVSVGTKSTDIYEYSAIFQTHTRRGNNRAAVGEWTQFPIAARGTTDQAPTLCTTVVCIDARGGRASPAQYTKLIPSVSHTTKSTDVTVQCNSTAGTCQENEQIQVQFDANN